MGLLDDIKIIRTKKNKKREFKEIEFEVSGVKFTVYTYSLYSRTWLLTCDEFNIECEDMNTDNIEEALVKAKEYMCNFLNKEIIRLMKVKKILKENDLRQCWEKDGG